MIKVPSKTTLKKYGITEAEWLEMLASQGNVCQICKKEPTTGRFVVDHFHAKGWKKKPPEIRRLYIRGICCWYCNHAYLGRGINVAKAKAVVEYLEKFEAKIETLKLEGKIK